MADWLILQTYICFLKSVPYPIIAFSIIPTPQFPTIFFRNPLSHLLYPSYVRVGMPCQ